jgi:hypothetical protein
MREKGWKPWARDFSNLVFGTKLKPKKEPSLRTKLEKVNKDWDKEHKKLKKEDKKRGW